MWFEKKVEVKNERRFKRLRADYLVKYQIAGQAEEEPRVANIKNISAGGVKFWSDQYLPENALLKVRLFIPPLRRTIETLGRLLRIRRAEHGGVFYLAVGFVEMPKADQNALNEFIENLSINPQGRYFVDHADVVKRETELARL